MARVPQPPGRPRRGGLRTAVVALGALAVTGWGLAHPDEIAVALALLVFGIAGLRLLRRWRRSVRLRTHTDLRTILLMDSARFEDFCCELLVREGYRARSGRRVNDEGVDIALEGPSGSGIAQVKRWTGTPVGRPFLQQLYGEMAHRRASYGYFITTSWFTLEATRWARDKAITLVDGPRLERLASKHFGRYPLRTDEIVPGR